MLHYQLWKVLHHHLFAVPSGGIPPLVSSPTSAHSTTCIPPTPALTIVGVRPVEHTSYFHTRTRAQLCSSCAFVWNMMGLSRLALFATFTTASSCPRCTSASSYFSLCSILIVPSSSFRPHLRSFTFVKHSAERVLVGLRSWRALCFVIGRC